jgi:uncharacterized protein (DUF2237 family)
MNVLGTEIQTCSTSPLTGFYRNGCCETGPEDRGLHLVCVVLNESFLRFSKSVGNDLSTPMPAHGFAGLKPGDRWCLCVQRWREAYLAGAAPLVNLEATHISTLEFVDLAQLREYAAEAGHA